MRKKPIISHCFHKTLREFGRSSTLHGIRYLFNRHLLVRCVWWTIELTMVYYTISLLHSSWYEFIKNPTVTSLEDKNYPVEKIEFPGISVCNLNKLSRKRVEEFTRKMANQTQTNETTLRQQMHMLGKLIDYTSAPEKQLASFQKLLDLFYSFNKTEFDPYRTLKLLSPSCSELLNNCWWANANYSCKELFVRETTSEGFCCLFNYLSKTSKRNSSILKDNKFQLLRPTMAGINGGLRFTIVVNFHDYFYTITNSIGVNLHIFNPNEFPDAPSGGLIERLIGVDEEVLIRLNAIKLYATQEVKQYPAQQRKCVFRDEVQTIFGNGYSYSDCLVECRIKSIISLCHCVPFMFYNAAKYLNLNQSQCTLYDVFCLSMYKDKWKRLFPHDLQDVGIEIDQEDSLNCAHCYPVCSNTYYDIDNDFIPLSESKKLNRTYVQIYFASKTGHIFKQDVIYYWFEMIGNFGGIFALLLGLSLISVIEIWYFFTVRFVWNLVNATSVA